MKAILSSTGFFSLSIMTLGGLFKIQHYPGASLMLIVGTMIFVFAFLPTYFIHRIKTKGNQLEVFEALGYIVSVALIALGILFRVQHYPGSSIMLILGMCLFIMLFIPLYALRFFQEKKQRNSQNILVGMTMIALTIMFMAHNLSKETLSSYVVNEEKIATNNEAIRKANEGLYRLASASKPETQLERIKQIKHLSSKIDKLLESYKIYLLEEIEGNWDEKNSYTEGKKVELKHSSFADHRTAPTAILIGFSSASPRDDEWSAIQLKRELIQHRERLVELAQSEELKLQLEEMLSYQEVRQYGYLESWEIGYFYHMPLASVIHTLSVLQNATLTAESLVLSESIGN
ncbi:MAG: hypothetical protein CL840_14215 [Crocinitomicaceae bacterium]|nr:hypothetical protein [Crocinitomicaceae bacterium]|tara:strand:+ start:3387 stop:4424 length:1038 start_codon:yes stop_codon:yes gene_type:complete